MKKLNCPNSAYILILISIIFCCPGLQAQKLPDSPITKISRVELGNYYMKKSKNQKLLGYALLGTGLASFAASIGLAYDESNAAAPLLILSTIALASSNPALCSGSKSKGKAEMLLREPAPGESSDDVMALAKRYQKNATISSIAAWTLFVGGLTGLFIAADDGSDTGAVLSTLSMFASLPVWMNAAKNKGRVSILLKKENVPVSYKANPSMPSIGISIPISR
ncbi:MAG TPA: hypothetical protein VK166_13085 [Chitinophagaceae bacterium]|nr:hypothetical protein [Chitinophagaceae bacterium]